MPDSGPDVDRESTPAGGRAKPVIAVAWPKPDYLESLALAGADIRVLTPARDALPGALEGCAGVLLTGGEDVDPALYHAADRHPTVKIDPARDDYEIALTRAALDRGLPLLAICRGVQVLNVAAGGSLVQDLPSEQPTALAHKPGGAPDAVAHDVVVSPDSHLERLLGDALDASHRVAVNSRHHQSVKEVAPGFRVTAVAPDGVVEAIEKPDAPFCLGVQWHPENFWRTGTFEALFKGLVDAARR
jgi:putative glutamine amidotransferase